MNLRRGITTGTCAAAAAKAAASVLVGGNPPPEVELRLPSGATIRVPVLYAEREANPAAATAAVRKDAGDDPDVTHGLEVRVRLSWDDEANATFVAGEGVGTVTKPGLQVPPGQPAINPVPRQMILAAVREITARGVRVEISLPGGREIAAKTFNPRLGIEGGLSVLGTTGVVRPYCTRALQDALKCTLDVAAACGVTAPVLVPGNIGARAARRHFSLREEQVIEAGNEWGFVLDLLSQHAFRAVMLLGHPGKLAKLAAGQWDTHSARSGSVAHDLSQIGPEFLGYPLPDSTTAEGVFAALPRSEQTTLAVELARRVRAAAAGRIGQRLPVAVFLVNMAGDCLGSDGDLAPWPT
jgi:cobalt-precorrin-5B (C1)-methyltransferase